MKRVRQIANLLGENTYHREKTYKLCWIVHSGPKEVGVDVNAEKTE
jgi:hypothetical protein